MYAIVGDSYEYKAPGDVRYDSYWVDEWEISDPSAAANAMEPGYAELFAIASTPIDRQTYVYIFSRALPAEAFKEINNIPDNSIPDVAVTQGIWGDGIYLFYRAGILNGTDNKGTFNPEGSIQRSEVAAILNSMMDESVRVGAPSQLGK